MVVEEFNINQGIYIFKLNNLETEFHSHPAIEIIIAKQGSFTLWVENAEYQNLKFAIIETNHKHKIYSEASELEVIMIEHHNKLIKSRLILSNIEMENGSYSKTDCKNENDIVYSIIQKIKNENLAEEYDSRISATINYLNNHELEYIHMIKTLQELTNLSESRLSHLFKSNIGISLKKYLIWTKLKYTIKQYLNKENDLFSSLINNGFYDQPHFSKTFKEMLGIKPSKAYNSRILQVLSI